MIAEFIDCKDAKWMKFLEQASYDFYHLPGYVGVCAAEEGAQPMAFCAEADGAAFLLPLLVRTLPSELDAPPEWSDALTPYGYPGPLLNPPGDRACLEEFLSAFKSATVDRNIVSVFVRLHPLLELPLDVLQEHGTLLAHGETVYIDLSLPEETLWRQMRRNHRDGIRKLLDAGFTYVIDDWDLYDSFVSMYLMTMERVSAADYYHFSKGYFQKLRQSLGERLHISIIKAPDGNPAAGGMFVEADSIVQLHLSATVDQYLPQGPSKLMFDSVRRWAKGRDNRYLHLGGGRGANSDALLHFKKGFSPLSKRFYSFRMITDQKKYDMLTQESLRISGSNICLRDDNFFPAYRCHLQATA